MGEHILQEEMFRYLGSRWRDKALLRLRKCHLHLGPDEAERVHTYNHRPWVGLHRLVSSIPHDVSYHRFTKATDSDIDTDAGICTITHTGTDTGCNIHTTSTGHGAA